MTTTIRRPFSDVARDLYPLLRWMQRDLRGRALALPIDDPRGGELVLVAGHASLVAERIAWLCAPLELGRAAVDASGLVELHNEMIDSIDDIASLEVATMVGLLGSLIASVQRL